MVLFHLKEEKLYNVGFSEMSNHMV